MVPIFCLIACLIAIAASITDIWRFKVYNALTFPAMGLGILYHAMAPEGKGAVYAISGLALGLGLLLIPYMFGIVGAGDAKFVAAVGTWLGTQPLWPSLVVGALVSGIYAIVILLTRGGVRRAWLNLQLTLMSFVTLGRSGVIAIQNETVQQAAQTAERRNRLIPFSAMIGIGVFYSTITYGQ